MTSSLVYPRCKIAMEVVLDGRGAPNSTPFHLEIEPRSASIGLNGYYEADTYSVDIDERLVPFDPDEVAYCAIRVYMWDARANLSHSEWAIDANEMVRGLADDIESSMIGQDRTIKFTCRDYTAILLDPEWDPKVSVPSGFPLDQTIQKIADLAAPPGTRARFVVEWRGEDPPPICGSLHRSHRGKKLAIKPNKSYWDVIWDLCLQHAYVARVERSTIIIEEPSTQTVQSLKEVPRLVYGKTLTELKIKRKFAREKVPQLIVVAWDPVGQRKVEITYPPKRNVTVRSTDALGRDLVTVKKDDQMYLPGPKGIIDSKALLRYARMRFYHMGRGETVYTMKTSHIMVDGPTPGQPFNLLQLRPGNAIGIQFDPFNREHLRALEIGQRVAYVVSLGYSQKIAEFVANNVDRMEMFRQEYYYNRGDISYDITDGLDIEIEAVNFSYAVREIHFAESGSPDAVSGGA